MASQAHFPSWHLLARTVGAAAVVVVTATAAVIPQALPAFAGPSPGPIPPTRFPAGYGYGAYRPGQPPDQQAPASGGGGHAKPAVARAAGPRKPPFLCGLGRFGMGVQGCNLPTLPGNPRRGPAGPAITPGQLALQEWRRLPVPVPQVRTAPPRGSEALVGLAEWFWVANWSARTGRAQAGAVWAQVTARPTRLTIDPGAGLPSVSCAGPGTVYDGARPAAAQHSSCSYTYLRSSAGLPGSAYRVTVTVTWGGTWQGSGGSGGTLPALARSASFSLPVAEGQAVTGG
jgi:hypothetical protein